MTKFELIFSVNLYRLIKKILSKETASSARVLMVPRPFKAVKNM